MKAVKNEYIKALIKITSNLNYAQDFRDGKLWMNRLAFFHHLEKKEIGDKNEGRALSFQTLVSMINMVDTSSLCMPIFCLYAIYGDNRPNTIIQIPAKILKFGQYAVIVKDVDYVAQIEGGLSDITTEILQTKSLVYPRNRKIQLNTDWNKVRVQDHIKYKNPLLGQGKEL